MANTTWSATDKLNVTVSSLTVSAPTAAGGVRTSDRQITGKFYFEYTCTTWTANALIGLANLMANLSTVATTAVNAAYVGFSGAIGVNNVASGSTLGARANGDIIGVALDLTDGLIWFRVAPAGNWNGSASANPATLAGGVSITSIIGPNPGAVFPLYGLVAFNASSTQTITANFGDTAFSGAVPSGFTSGFTAGATPTLYGVATQAAIEEWASEGATTVSAQMTQIAVEQWASAQATIPTQTIVTQLALEQWASVGLAPSAFQARVMMLP